MIDCLTELNELITLKDPFTTPSIVHLFAKEIICLHGIHHDRDKAFMNSFLVEYNNETSSTYLPQTDMVSLKLSTGASSNKLRT